MKVFLSLIFFMCLIGCSYENNQVKILQPKSDRPDFFEFNEFQIRQKVLYVPATTGTVKWGYLPNGTDTPVASMEAGSYLVVDALSHEGIWRENHDIFLWVGVKEDVLNDASTLLFQN